jgi:hypothetical protein
MGELLDLRVKLDPRVMPVIPEQLEIRARQAQPELMEVRDPQVQREILDQPELPVLQEQQG